MPTFDGWTYEHDQHLSAPETKRRISYRLDGDEYQVVARPGETAIEAVRRHASRQHRARDLICRHDGWAPGGRTCFSGQFVRRDGCWGAECYLIINGEKEIVSRRKQ